MDFADRLHLVTGVCSCRVIGGRRDRSSTRSEGLSTHAMSVATPGDVCKEGDRFSATDRDEPGLNFVGGSTVHTVGYNSSGKVIGQSSSQGRKRNKPNG